MKRNVTVFFCLILSFCMLAGPAMGAFQPKTGAALKGIPKDTLKEGTETTATLIFSASIPDADYEVVVYPPDPDMAGQLYTSAKVGPEYSSTGTCDGLNSVEITGLSPGAYALVSVSKSADYEYYSGYTDCILETGTNNLGVIAMEMSTDVSGGQPPEGTSTLTFSASMPDAEFYVWENSGDNWFLITTGIMKGMDPVTIEGLADGCNVEIDLQKTEGETGYYRQITLEILPGENDAGIIQMQEEDLLIRYTLNDPSRKNSGQAFNTVAGTLLSRHSAQHERVHDRLTDIHQGFTSQKQSILQARGIGSRVHTMTVNTVA